MSAGCQPFEAAFRPVSCHLLHGRSGYRPCQMYLLGSLLQCLPGSEIMLLMMWCARAERIDLSLQSDSIQRGEPPTLLVFAEVAWEHTEES